MDKLTEIMATTRKAVERRTRPVKEAELTRLGDLRKSSRNFREVLRDAPGLGVIAEIKRQSPSAGAIASQADAAEQARLYYNAGTDCISVLTDEPFFGGTIQDLWDVNDLLSQRADAPPTIRKDFFVDPIQIVEAAEAGAGAILLIVRALKDDELKRLFESASMAGLESLFEIHEAHELDRAIRLGAKLIGVNNRDLTRFVTDLSISEKLIPEFPEDCVAVSESGIKTIEDAERVFSVGADAILVGEALMKMKDPEPFIKGVHAL